MSEQLKNVLILVIPLWLCSLCSSCDLINPEEQIPSFIRIDSISLATTAGQGIATQDITDAWVFNNEQLVGIYELPATVPILASGSTPVRIRPGIKLNGQVGTRIVYLFANDLSTDLELFPDSQLHIDPVVGYRDWVTFKWIEDFEGQGMTLSTTSISQTEIQRVEGSEALNGKSAKLSLAPDQDIFECQSSVAFALPNGGAPVLLEFNYKCNHSLVVGLFNRDPSVTTQVPLLVLNPTDHWKRVFMNLTNSVSSNANFIDHRPFFGFVRDEGFVGQIDVYLDNIRLIY